MRISKYFFPGWGQDFFVGGSMQSVMREIDVPLIDQDTCQAMLRNNTELGPMFGLDKTSFVCAGALKNLLKNFNY